MAYSCPVCGHDETAYLRCHHPGCPDGRDALHPNNVRRFAPSDAPRWPCRADDGNSYRHHVTGLPAGGDAMRTVEDDFQEELARKRKLSPLYPSQAELERRLRHHRMWKLAALIAIGYITYCAFWVH